MAFSLLFVKKYINDNNKEDGNMAYYSDEYIQNQLISPRALELKARANRCKCKYCGGKLRVKQIVYSNVVEPRIEIFCEDCNRIEYGVEPEIYMLAKYYSEEFHYDFYPELDDSESKVRMNIAKICEVMFWILNRVGYLDAEGFKYPIALDKELTGLGIEFDMDDMAQSFSENSQK